MPDNKNDTTLALQCRKTHGSVKETFELVNPGLMANKITWFLQHFSNETLITPAITAIRHLTDIYFSRKHSY